MLPPLDEVLGASRVVALPLRRRFRGIDVREAVLLRGPAGWAEFAPFVDYDDAEGARWLAAALEAGWHGWPAPVRDEVPVNATVPAVPACDVAGVLEMFPGCSTAKVKVAEPGQRLADDVARVRQVRRSLGAGGRVRVDANGGWALDQALDALRALAPCALEYAEQPCARVDELARLRVLLARARLEVPVAADESVRRAADPLAVTRAGAADVVVVKVAPLGGVRAALRIAAECGVPVVVSSALDTSVGLAAGVALAGALPDLPYACGLGTAALLSCDVTTSPLLPRNGRIPVRPVTVDEALLTASRATADRRRWWLHRLARCYDVMRSDVVRSDGSG